MAAGRAQADHRKPPAAGPVEGRAGPCGVVCDRPRHRQFRRRLCPHRDDQCRDRWRACPRPGDDHRRWAGRPADRGRQPRRAGVADHRPQFADPGQDRGLAYQRGAGRRQLRASAAALRRRPGGRQDRRPRRDIGRRRRLPARPARRRRQRGRGRRPTGRALCRIIAARLCAGRRLRPVRSPASTDRAHAPRGQARQGGGQRGAGRGSARDALSTMALGDLTAPTLPRVNSGAARLVPILTTIIAAILAILPLRIPGYAALTPALALMAVYHWTIYRPDLLPAFALFAIGIGEDLLAGSLVGIGALTLLVTRAAVLQSRRLFVGRTFPFVWAGFTLVAGGALLGLWALHCLLEFSFINPRNTVFRMVLTIAVFPAASFLLGRTQRALIDGPRHSR